MVIHIRTEVESDNITEILQDEVSAVVEHSAVVEVLEEEVEISSERWNPAHFGETPRKVDANGNPTIFWDESIEPPEPDDFESLEEYEEAWLSWEKQNSDNLICAAELGQASPLRELSPEKLNYADSAKLTNSVKKDCAFASPESQSTTTCETSNLKEEASTALPHHYHANPLPSKESAWVEQIHETVSPQYCELLTELNPNSSVSKTSSDCYRHSNVRKKNPEHILNRCSGNFGSVGTMHNGLLSERDLNLEPSGLGKDFYSLPRPGALSCSVNGRPPGNTKSEGKAKKLGLIGKNEVFNPEWLEQEFGLPIGWTDPQERRAATELLELEGQPSETASTTGLLKSHGNEYSTSTHLSVKEQSGNYSTTTPNTLKAISLWQPWASLISLGLKHYETRNWKTNYRGKLLICSTLNNSKHHQKYLKIKDNLQLPPWDEDNFPHGQAIALCDLVDCIEITPDFIAQQSQTEILCDDWQVARYAWKLENIQPITEPFAVKGKQGLFNIPSTNFESYLKHKFTLTQESKKDNKKSDHWYTPLHIVDLVVQVLGAIDIDPCADDGKHIKAAQHYTFNDDGLTKPWYGRVYMNPPYSCPGLWMKKLQAEFESGRVKEAISEAKRLRRNVLVPAATDTNWLSPRLKTQPVCFWKGRIKFLDKDYQPRQAARQSHVLVYWGKNWERFKEVFEPYGVIYLPLERLDGGELNKFLLGDKQDNSPSKIISPELSSPSNLLGDEERGRPGNLLEENSPSKIISPELSPSNLLGDKEETSPSKNDLSPSKDSPSNLLGDKGETSPSKNSPSNLLGDKGESSPSKNISPSKYRNPGESNGYIHWRTITKNGKKYPQAYYHWKEGNKKRSKYIPKKLFGSVEEADSTKSPVIEILKMLGVETSPSKLLGDVGSSPSNDVNIFDSANKLLGEKWIKNGEINILQGSQGSPSNLDNSPELIELPPSKRCKGDGSGSIHWRIITRGGKDYPQAYYHYEIWSGGDRLVKSSKYIPKRLLPQVQRLESEKAPVKEILKLLGVVKYKN